MKSLAPGNLSGEKSFCTDIADFLVNINGAKTKFSLITPIAKGCVVGPWLERSEAWISVTIRSREDKPVTAHQRWAATGVGRRQSDPVYVLLTVFTEPSYSKGYDASSRRWTVD